MKKIAILLSLSLAGVPQMSVAQTRNFDELSETEKQDLANLINSGKSAYNEGEFEKSLDFFGRAYGLYPHPDILYRMGLCYERLGEDASAIRYYRQFLQEVPDAPERPRIEKTIEVIENRVARSSIQINTVPEGAIVYIDDIANGPAGLTPTSLPIKPGDYRIIVKRDGFQSIEELVTVSAGGTVQLRYQLVREDLAVDPAPVASSNPDVLPTVGLMMLGVGSTIAALSFFASYSADVDELKRYDDLRRINPQNITRTQYEDTKSSRNLNLGLSIGFTTVAVGAFVWSYLRWNSTVYGAAPVPASGPSNARLQLQWNDGPGIGYGFEY
jgi:tetratricopeptide (TPR) repeat protein